MICETVVTPAGAMIVCRSGRRKRCTCGRAAKLECDWKVPARRSGTCDRPLCESCSFVPAPGKDLCADHARAYAHWKAVRGQ